MQHLPIVTMRSLFTSTAEDYDIVADWVIAYDSHPSLRRRGQAVRTTPRGQVRLRQLANQPAERNRPARPSGQRTRRHLHPKQSRRQRQQPRLNLLHRSGLVSARQRQRCPPSRPRPLDRAGPLREPAALHRAAPGRHLRRRRSLRVSRPTTLFTSDFAAPKLSWFKLFPVNLFVRMTATWTTNATLASLTALPSSPPSLAGELLLYAG